MFSSLGFYPVSPGSDEYALGSPAVKTAVLNLENGKKFTVEAIGQSDRHVYVSKVFLNGKLVKGHSIRHADIVDGGVLRFVMTDKSR
jgi:putative alpha-1,2-mannosidase